MSKKNGFSKFKKVKLATMFVVVVIGVTLIVSVYNQNQSNKKAQDVILQQKEAAIKTQNQKQAELDKQAEQKKLDAQKALDAEKKLEQQKVLDNEKKIEAEKVKKEAEAAAAAAIVKENAKNSKPTQEVAVEIVSKIIIKKDSKTKVSFDHMQNRDGKDYYVIHAYDDMIDHINTLGWYYVQVDTGKAFEWDLIKDTLTPIN